MCWYPSVGKTQQSSLTILPNSFSSVCLSFYPAVYGYSVCVCVWQILTQSPSVLIISLFDPHNFSHHRSQPSDAAFSRVPYTINAFGATLKKHPASLHHHFLFFLKGSQSFPSLKKLSSKLSAMFPDFWQSGHRWFLFTSTQKAQINQTRCCSGWMTTAQLFRTASRWLSKSMQGYFSR